MTPLSLFGLACLSFAYPQVPDGGSAILVILTPMAAVAWDIFFFNCFSRLSPSHAS